MSTRWSIPFSVLIAGFLLLLLAWALAPGEAEATGPFAPPALPAHAQATTTAITPNVLISFDFDDGPEGWLGLPGDTGCPPAVWDGGEGRWEAVVPDLGEYTRQIRALLWYGLLTRDEGGSP